MQKSKIWGDESRAVDLALDWAKAHTVSGSDPKTTFKSHEDLDASVPLTITEGGLGAEEALRIYSELLNPATRSSDDPMNLAFIPCAPTRAAVAFDTVVSAANVFGGIWEMGSGAIYAENQVLDWMKSLLRWPDTAHGTFVAGGTLGNLSAISVARNTAREKWQRVGKFQNGKPLTGFKLGCSSSTHSSVRTIAKVLDVEVVTIPLDERGHLTGENVARAIEENPGMFAIVASAGTTNAGIVDDIEDIVREAHKHDVWVHVDGAYGGGGLAGPSIRHRYNGIEEADSFIVDPHKWLFAPYDCCALLYRNPEHAIRTFSQHAEYLDVVDRSESNPSDLAVHLSRRTRGLPLWYSLATHGTKRYSDAVEMCVHNARTCAEYIRNSNHLSLIMEPELSIVLFKRVGWSDEDYRKWSKEMATSARMLCLTTKHNGETVLRLAFLNPDTNIDTVIDYLEHTMN